MLIDAHCHLDARFGGGWIERPAAELLAVLDEAKVERLVDLSGGWGVETLRRHLDHFKAAAPDRFTMLAGVDWDSWSEHRGAFGAAAERSLRRQLHAGAAGLKVWKSLGLDVRDHRDALVAIDDPRLDHIWHVCDEWRVPVVIHVGDPIEFFRPAGPDNARSAEIAEHPEWHWHQLSEATAAGLLEQFEGLLSRWRQISFVGAHLLDLLHAPGTLGDLLDRHPNLSVDLGARFMELQVMDPAMLATIGRHPTRILYGLDHPPSVEMYRSTVQITRQLLAAARPGDDSAIEQVLRGNAAAIFRD